MWESCTASVQATAEPQIYLKLPIHYSHPLIFNEQFKIILGCVRTSRLDQNVPHESLSIP